MRVCTHLHTCTHTFAHTFADVTAGDAVITSRPPARAAAPQGYAEGGGLKGLPSLGAGSAPSPTGARVQGRLPGGPNNDSLFSENPAHLEQRLGSGRREVLTCLKGFGGGARARGTPQSGTGSRPQRPSRVPGQGPAAALVHGQRGRAPSGKPRRAGPVAHPPHQPWSAHVSDCASRLRSPEGSTRTAVPRVFGESKDR